ncbi:hypothetical protein [Ekhidna sp.]|uniref:hypothetical protein n=1 Tax=Ekhidna sp. TaxID=2608089 RepID=UPI003CCBEC6B
MKSLLLLLMLSASVLLGSAEATMHDNQGLNMQIDSDLVFQQMVKIYTYDGELVKELSLNDVANNKISVIDHIVLQESDFAFDHQGDYYYFRDTKDAPEILN